MTKKKPCKPGRRKLTCVKEGCGKPFSTHSSNRTVCHQCKPKAPAWKYVKRVPKEEKKK